jgi:hypothetical protein
MRASHPVPGPLLALPFARAVRPGSSAAMTTPRDRFPEIGARAFGHSRQVTRKPGVRVAEKLPKS